MQDLYFQYYVASFLCHCVCALWHELGERSLLIGTGRPTANTPSVDEVAGIVTDLAFDTNVRASIKQFEKQIWYVERDSAELIDNWIARLQKEAASLVDEHICENYSFNIQQLYFAFVSQVIRDYCNLANQIASQLNTLNEHVTAYSQLIDMANKIEKELDFAKSELGIDQEKVGLLQTRKLLFSRELALSWRKSVVEAY